MQRAEQDGDPGLMALVRKEVTFELARSRHQCTLFKVNWVRRPLATGILMKNGRVKLPVLKRIPLSRVNRSAQDATLGGYPEPDSEVKEEVKCERTVVKVEDLLVSI